MSLKGVFFLLLFTFIVLTGLAYFYTPKTESNDSLNKKIYRQTVVNCPNICKERSGPNSTWSGMVKVELDKLVCVCETK